MAHNLFISYDLISPGQNYEAVTQQIKTLGPWAKVHYSLFYVRSEYNSEQAASHVKQVLDPNDKVIAIEASAAHWYNLSDAASKQIREQWSA